MLRNIILLPEYGRNIIIINKEISVQLNSKTFKKFENIKIGTSSEIIVQNKYRSSLKLMGLLIYNCFFNNFNVNIPTVTKHLFFIVLNMKVEMIF